HRAVINTARFLQTLDADGDPSNGINISSEMRSVISASEAKIQFDVETSEFENSNSAILNVVTAIPLADGKPREIKGVVAALSHFQNTLASTSSTPLASLSGEVTNNSGVPLQGVMVSLMRDVQGEAALLKMTTTNQDGYYEFPKVLIGDYTIIATNSQSVERAALTQATVSSASSITLQTLQLTPTGSLSGQITLEGTANPEGIMVYLLGTNYVAMTDDQGKYTFTGVPVGTYALKATFDGFESQKQSSIEINSGDIAKMTALHLISLNSPLRKGAIQGVVDQTSAPLSAPARLMHSFSRMIGLNRNAEKNNSQCIGCGVKAWPVGGSDNSSKDGTIDEKGNFEIEDLNPGVYDIEITSNNNSTDNSDDQGTLIQNVVVEPGKMKNIGFLKLEKMGAVSGMITLDGSDDHSNVDVKILGASGSSVTSKSGYWEINLIPEGTYDLIFEKEEFAQQMISVEIKSGQKTQLESVKLSSAFGIIEGMVELEDNTLNQPVLISLGETGKTLMTDNGTFQFKNVPIGKHTIFLSSLGHLAEKVQDLDVNSNEITKIDKVTLKSSRTSGSLYGMVSTENGINPGGTSVLLVETGQVTVVNSQGGFVLNGVDQGIYTIEFFRSGFKSVQLARQGVLAGTSTKIRSNNV
ncbi:MAG: carboxypeptidase regulatory-like domain-containing protein, partial [Verrucomicrobiota bacterium]|nr:carboxypeptidase regulatory-like domain-containing protein [Verrucomicrobiota bacterium]